MRYKKRKMLLLLMLKKLIKFLYLMIIIQSQNKTQMIKDIIQDLFKIIVQILNYCIAIVEMFEKMVIKIIDEIEYQKLLKQNKKDAKCKEKIN